MVVHYDVNNAECIDVIRNGLDPAEFRGFLKGNVIKYLYREGHKRDRQSDLEKAADYACYLAHGMWLERYAAKVGNDFQRREDAARRAIMSFGVQAPDEEENDTSDGL